MNTAAAPIRVMLADDEPLVLGGIAAILNAQPDIEVVGTARDGAEAVDLAAVEKPDVICMDIEMPRLNGIEATGQILQQLSTEVVILTTFNREDYLLQALRAGASGFLLKTATPEQLTEGIRSVASGDALLAPEVTRSLIQRAVAEPPADAPTTSPVTPRIPATAPVPQPVEPLSDREREVLAHAALGLSNAEIAEALFVSAETVKSHMSRVLAKLNLRNRIEAVAYAYRTGIVAQ
ncbi:response regulator [Nesterenkonia alba]|uniref:response regulator n=1 Tax=Nesterenkonia alba TaxID=515814 RepID=UPI0003B7A333|nr:response regulator transcription factor [Nesterenkonia alba]